MTKDGSIRVGLVSLAKIDITAAQTTPFFNLGNLIGQMRAIEEGGLSPKTVAKMPTEHDVSKGEVVSVNRRFAGPDHNLNAPLRQDGESEWQDWLVDAWDGGE